ncbi:MAG: amino acid adenylation domain-containing protein, partial [Aldersonia sp.]|nr:amino acid adenylation domain-containing protein [Aldersonia sp.]
DYGRPLDLLNDRLIRAAILRLADDRWYWYQRVHHIVLDGFGAMTGMQRVAELYTAAVTAVPAKPARAGGLRELYDTEMAYRDSSRFRTDKEYWAERVAGLEQGTSLVGRSAAPVAENGIVSAALTDDQSRRLAAAVERLDASDAVVLLASFAVYLAQMTGSHDVILSLPVTARTTAAMRRSGGMVSNVVPLRLHVGPETTVADLMRSVRVEVSGALRHQRYRHEDIRRDSPSATNNKEFFGPWVNIMLFHSELAFGPIVGQLNVLSTGSVEDLGVNFYQSVAGSRAHIDFETNTNLYTAAEARRHHERFLALFDRFLDAEPDRPVWSMPVATEAERHLTLEVWNDTAHPVPDATLAGMLARRVADPAAVAVDFEGATLTNADFDARVNQLARRLIESGVGPGSLVALAIRRSLDLVVAIHAVIATGGAYVPLDPDHPVERIDYILRASTPEAVLTTSSDRFDGAGETPVVEIDALDLTGVPAGPVADSERTRPLLPDDLAYVIFTSGSTGRPKGVAVSQRAIANQMVWMLAEYDFDASDVYLQKTATTFDVSLWGYFLPILAGAKLVVATPTGHQDPAYLAATIERQSVTVTDFVPSMLAVFIGEATPAQCTSLRHVYAAGEALPAEVAVAFRELSPAQLHNMYGPTEAAVSVTYREVLASDVPMVPIGGPEWNVRVYVLDDRLRPAAIGASGELYLAGPQLARGYLGRPELTADRFVANPFDGNGSRLYRTGDLVRWRADGALDYLGRVDFQVKLRGQRIELGEIESQLLAHPSVGQAVVVVSATNAGERLLGYVVPQRGHSVDPAEVIRFVAGKLPNYMVPTAISILASFPLNASGKLDRKALPAVEITQSATEYRAPRTQAETIVAGAFAELLGVERVGIDDNFFELGGNSLVAAQAVSRVGTSLGTRLGIRALFEAPTVAGLASRAESQSREGRPRAELRPMPRPDRVPLSYAQQRMWFLNRYDVQSSAYNLPVVIRLTGALDVAALRRAIGDVVARHESLRTRYPAHDGVPYQLVVPAEDAVPTLEPVTVGWDGLRGVVADFVSAGFDVAEQIPFRAALFRTAPTEHVLAVVAHHISADGWSMGPLARDMVTAYLARLEGDDPGWSPLAVQYADFALWQREVLGSEDDPNSVLSAQAEYWRSALAGLPEELGLPTDRPRPSTQSFAGGHVGFAIDAELRAALGEVARTDGVTEFMVVHAALAVFLARMSGTDDVSIGTPIAGRGERELDELIGMFVNTLVLRSRVQADLPFLEFLQHVRETDLAAFAHADLPFERLVELLNPERSTARHPLFQVALSFENLPSIGAELPDLSVSPVDLDSEFAKFDLQLTLRHGPDGGMAASLSYARDLFDESTVRGFADRFLLLLRAIVARPDASVGDLPMLSGTEFDLLTHVHGDDVMARGMLPDMLTSAVERHPAKTAVRYQGRSISYGEIDEYSSRLARVLIESGVGPDSLVALAFPRSYVMVAAVWEVAKTGGAYVPFDPTFPDDR